EMAKGEQWGRQGTISNGVDTSEALFGVFQAQRLLAPIEWAGIRIITVYVYRRRRGRVETVHMLRKIVPMPFFDRPKRRSTKIIGTSASRNPRRCATNFNSTRNA